MKTIRLAITGFGNVGKRVAHLVEERQHYLNSQFGVRLIVTGVCGSSRGLIDPDGISPEKIQAKNAYEAGLTGAHFIEQVPADILIEAGPSNYVTGQPGREYIHLALSRGIHIVTISKGALVVDGPKIIQTARETGSQLRMSGAAASALPTIDFLTYDLAGTRIEAIEAILTGTTTFVLDTMLAQDMSFEEALSEAQRRGIAEPDPSFDIDGWDTAAKVTIIANAVFGAALDINDLPRQSLREASVEALTDWQNQGLTPRLVGYIENTDTGIEAGVDMRLYSQLHPFSLTKGSSKGLSVRTTEMGEFNIVGGASDPTATAAAAMKDIDHIISSL